MAEYIDRILLGEAVSHGMVHYEDIMSMPTADVVERKVLDQVYWERDIALYQLAEIGKELGEKMDDVVERKHGKWVDGNCSVCGRGRLCYGDRSFCTSPYCPWCGAYMMESESEDG